MIDDYLGELLAHLELPARRRRRIVAEIEDHLACAAAELHAEGLTAEQAEREAVSRFGPARELAHTFLEQEAARGGLLAAQAGSVFALVCGVLLIGAPGRVLFEGNFPAGVPAFALGQVALVAGGLTLIRAWPRDGLRGARLVLVLRGVFVVAGCAAGGLVDAALRALLGGRAWGAAGWAALAVLSLGTVVTAATAARGRRGARVVPPSAHADEPRDIVDTLDRYLPWLGLRRHPWRFALTVAVAAGVAIAAAHALTEGGPSLHHLARQLHGAGLLVGTEALATLLGFALLGRYLGLRSGTGAAAPER